MNLHVLVTKSRTISNGLAELFKMFSEVIPGTFSKGLTELF